MTLSSQAIVQEFQVEQLERYRLFSIPQAKVKTEYKNTILSIEGWNWKGNVLVESDRDSADCKMLDWLEANMDSVRQILEQGR